jgi:hypothetical protein
MQRTHRRGGALRGTFNSSNFGQITNYIGGNNGLQLGSLGRTR